MKKLTIAATLIFSCFLWNSCADGPKGDEAKVTDEQAPAAASGSSYTADAATSYVRFTGNGVGKAHPGRFKLSDGTLAVENGVVTGGQFTINMNSLDMEEEGEAIDNKLQPHLLSKDFFDAATYGTAKFEITGVAPYKPDDNNTSVVEGANYTVSGNLTLKDVTKNVSFPAKIDVTENSADAKANFDIDRTQWNIVYGNDKKLGDKFISETVNVEVMLKANKM